MLCIFMMLESFLEYYFFWLVFSFLKCSFRSFVKLKLINSEEKTQILYIYIELVISGLDFLYIKKLVYVDVFQDFVMVSKYFVVCINFF